MPPPSRCWRPRDCGGPDCCEYAGLVTTFMMSRFRYSGLWLEHQGTPETHRLHCISTRLAGCASCACAAQLPWMHWEHHVWPTIPYHRLAKVRKHDTERPVWTLGELLRWVQTGGPYIPSGQAVTAARPMRSSRCRARPARSFGHSCIDQKQHSQVVSRLPCRRYSGRLLKGRSDSRMPADRLQIAEGNPIPR